MACLQRTGEVTYNGVGFKEFIPERTSAYVTQYDDVRLTWTAAPMSQFSLGWPTMLLSGTLQHLHQ